MSNVFSLRIVACGTNYGEPPTHDVCYYLGHHEPWASRFGVAGRKSVINPYYDENLRPLTGRHPIIYDYIFADEEAQWRRQRIDTDLVRLFDSVRAGQPHRVLESVDADANLPMQEDDVYVIVTLCTGGKHRSQTFAVYISRKAQSLADDLGIELNIDLVFRDDGRE